MKKRILTTVSAILFAIALSVMVTGEGGVALAAQEFTTAFQQCAITDGNTVTAVVSTSALPASDDGVFYLFEQPTYAAALGNNIAQAPMAAAASFSFELNKGEENTRLYSKFAVAVKQGGQFVQVSNFCYITNPEAIATTRTDYPIVGKKGLMISPVNLNTDLIEDLGVQHTTISIDVGSILGPTTNGNYPTINYKYNGKNYSFNGHKIYEYDAMFKALTSKGVIATAVLCNNFVGNYPQMIHPQSRAATTAPYYMFNAAEQAGVEYISAVGSFLAKRYSGIGVGRVANWVIGNEVTARAEWNYMNYVSDQYYAEEYAKALRVMYTAIRSEQANARVYISMDHTWDRNQAPSDGFVDGKDLLDYVNASIMSTGNIDWGVSYHPYPVPLTWSAFWNMPAQYKAMNLVRNSENTPMITVANLGVLTDYLSKPQFISPTGQVRNIIIDEIGFGNGQGEEVQTAAICYAFYQVLNNQHIDYMVLARDIDIPAEAAQGLCMGLESSVGAPRNAYNIYKYIDTPEGAGYTAPYLGVVGVSSWSQVIQAR